MTSVIALSDGSKANARNAPCTVKAVDAGGKAIARDSSEKIKAVSLSSTVIATSAIANVEVDIDLSNDTALQVDVLSGKTYHSMNGYAEGTMPNRDGASGTISTVDGSYTIQDGYHDGTGSVSISSTEQAKIIAENIKAGVTILGVTGTHEGGGTVTAQEKSVTPSDSVQVVVPDTGYDYLSKVTVSAVVAMTEAEVTAAVEEGWTGGNA